MTRPRERLRNIGISAHIDAGKTTLSERVLFYAKRIHRMTDVRERGGRGPTMSTMDLEVEKGITIRSAATSCEWAGHFVTLIDTPGHVDFGIEVERALRVLDGAVLVLCAVGGVQAQSITVDRQMRRWAVPRLAFVNKCDRPGADPLGVCRQLRERLGLNAVMIQHPLGLEDDHVGLVDLVTREACTFEGRYGEQVRRGPCPPALRAAVEAQRQLLVEALAEHDPAVADAFLAGAEPGTELLRAALRRATIARAIVPVCLGSAYRNKGVQPLLDDVIRYLPSPIDRTHEALDRAREEEPVRLRCDPGAPLVALAFKLQEERHGQLTHVRVYQGTLRRGDPIVDTTTGQTTKVSRLVRMHSDAMEDIAEAQAGDIAALFGVECATGDTFTDGGVDYAMTSMHVPEPVVSLAVAPARQEDATKLGQALARFAREDPTLRVTRDEESAETIVGGMGELHLEVLLERVRREHGVEVVAGEPRVAYRETITRRAEFEHTHRKQSGGAGQYARLVGFVEPLIDEIGDPAEGHEFVDATRDGAITRGLLRAAGRGFARALREGGLVGAPVVGVRMVVSDGGMHDVDSKDVAFEAAARDAFRDASRRAGPALLEPIMKVEVEGPGASAGAILGGLNRRRGVVQESTTTGDGRARITALVPLRELFGYGSDLRSQTRGEADVSFELARRALVPRHVQDALVARAAS